MNNNDLLVLSTFVHVLAATVWVGGMLFMGLVLIPAVRANGDASLRVRLISAVGKRFRPVGWTCLAILFGTGLLNLQARGISNASLADAEFWKSAYGHTLGIKMGLFAVILILSLVHDLTADPIREDRPPTGEEALRIRRRASTIGRVIALLSALAMLFAVMLPRGYSLW